MWTLLRSRRLADFKFRRQAPIGRYIADFLCPEKKLIVELDGSQHGESEADAKRDSWLRSQDFRVLRIWNNDLFERPDSVCEAVWAALMEVKR
jgi:very-short-patch-repair endonuclease